MRYRSTNGGETVSFKEATISGLAPDGGLYMPTTIPSLSNTFFESLRELSFLEIATEVAAPFLDEDLNPADIRRLVESSMTFNAPIVKLSEQVSSLELFHGPTCAFKDFGARFMAATLETFQRGESQPLTVLVATSGDTGGAVGHGFYGREGIRVVILYPRGMVSPLQEKQLTTLGGNVNALRVNGSFDDCQALVKGALRDPAITGTIKLTSANSINISRLIPQTFYYFSAVAQVRQEFPLVFSVPSGNFGNLTAGLIAKRMGLPIERFIAATNINDVVPAFLKSGNYSPRASVSTLANAMDVGSPSNFARMMALYDNNHEAMNRDVIGEVVRDIEIKSTIKLLHDTYSYVCDPHGAVGYLALARYLESCPKFCGVFLHTAHPAKFEETVRPLVGESLLVPQQLSELSKSSVNVLDISHSSEELRAYLLS